MNYEIFNIETIDDLINFISQEKIHIEKYPLNKILYLLQNKGYTKTIIKFSDIKCKHYTGECLALNKKKNKSIKYVFFNQKINYLEDLKRIKNDSIGGYCNLRPDYSISYAFINLRAIIRDYDTYAFLSCYKEESIQVTKDISFNIKGFPFMEKDNKISMCAQTALAIITDYFSSKINKYKSVTTYEINNQAGINISELKKRIGSGLTIGEILQFLNKQGYYSHYEIFYNKSDDFINTNLIRPVSSIYSYIESQIPVLAIIKVSGFHSLVIIGHTFDKNNWASLANLGYALKPLSGDGKYYSNMSWIKNFIVQDDNFGPYYFISNEALKKNIGAFIAILPSKKIRLKPLVAERAAFVALKKFVKKIYQQIVDNGDLLENNLIFAKHFLNKFKNRKIILRTFLYNKNYHKKDIFLPEISENLLNSHWYWVIEITWSELYCYQRLKIGEIIFNADDSNFINTPLIHLPGILINKYGLKIIEKPDSPEQHAELSYA